MAQLTSFPITALSPASLPAYNSLLSTDEVLVSRGGVNVATTTLAILATFLSGTIGALQNIADLRALTGLSTPTNVTVGTSQGGTFYSNLADTTTGWTGTARIVGNTLTISANSSGAMAVGLQVAGSGVTPAWVVSGSGTSWTLSGSSQNVSSQGMTADNGVSIFVDSAGVRWYRLNPAYTLLEAGADPTGVAACDLNLNAILGLGKTATFTQSDYGSTYLLSAQTAFPSFSRLIAIEGVTLNWNSANSSPFTIGQGVTDVGIVLSSAQINNTGSNSANVPFILATNADTVRVSGGEFFGSPAFLSTSSSSTYAGVTTTGADIAGIWTASTAVTAGQALKVPGTGRNYYYTGSGTTGSTPPMSFGSGITDGTATCTYANVCTNIHTSNISVQGEYSTAIAAVEYSYTIGGSINDVSCNRVYTGIQLWGGDANPSTGNGAVGNERKCKFIIVNNPRVSNTTSGGVFSSMAEGIQYNGGYAINIGDVGFDFEGCLSCVSNGNFGKDAVNGNFTTFFYNKDIEFVGVKSVQSSSSHPHWSINNSGQNTLNQNVRFVGGTYETLSGIGSAGTLGGPAETVTVDGGDYTNTILNLDTNNSFTTVVDNVNMLFTVANGSAFNAITVGGNNYPGSGGAGATASVTNSTIKSIATQPAGSYAIASIQADGSFYPTTNILDNISWGFPGDILVSWAGSNSGIYGIFNVGRNMMAAGVLGRSETGAAKSVLNLDRNVTYTGTFWPGSIPVSGFNNAGTRIQLNNYAGGYAEAVCTASGTPGTWSTMNPITTP